MDIGFQITILAIGGAVLLALVIIGLAVRAERARTEAMRTFASDRGIEFEPDASCALPQELEQLPLFQRGRRKRTRNLIRGRSASEPEWLFDYQYTTGSGKNHRTHRQTVAAFQLSGATLPEFDLRPEHFFHKIATAFGYQDIDLPEYPQFSSWFLLRGRDEFAVRGLFTGQRIEAVTSARNICLEGSGAWLIIYRAGKRVRPADLDDFLAEARSLRKAFDKRRR